MQCSTLFSCETCYNFFLSISICINPNKMQHVRRLSILIYQNLTQSCLLVSILFQLTKPTAAKTESLKTKNVLPLQVMSIKSDGANIDPTPISVTYAATLDHTTEWIGLRRNGGMWRTGISKDTLCFR